MLRRGDNAVEEFLGCLQKQPDFIEQNFTNRAKMAMKVTDCHSYDYQRLLNVTSAAMHSEQLKSAINITLPASTGGRSKRPQTQAGPYPDKCKVTMFLHNLPGYNISLHRITRALGSCKAAQNNKISCIPNDIEKYMTFSLRQLQFTYRLQFPKQVVGQAGKTRGFTRYTGTQ